VTQFYWVARFLTYKRGVNGGIVKNYGSQIHGAVLGETEPSIVYIGKRGGAVLDLSGDAARARSVRNFM
jgi:hypothetical protein